MNEALSSNITGPLLCTKYALEIMKKQENGGHVVMVDGIGSDHYRVAKGFLPLGSAKSGLTFMARSICAETKPNYPDVGIHRIHPGPVTLYVNI